MIYLDNAATTRMCAEAEEAMLPFFRGQYGNPSSIYGLARQSREAVRTARESIARMLNARPDEVFFTSGGTEADNWALIAAFEAGSQRGKHIITSRIEHPAVLRTCDYLERVRGARVTRLDVDAGGRVDPAEAEAAVCEDTILLSVMYANNETGTIQPVNELGEIAKRRGILFHTDAVQAFAHLPVDVDRQKIDLLSASGHKFNGPKGCGFLYMRKGSALGALIRGGSQEYSRRAGTENVPGIAGMAAAALEAEREMDRRAAYETELRDYMIRRLTEEIPGTVLNGDPELRLPNNVNCRFEGISAEEALIMLDMQGICASGGSACSTGSIDPSHVLLALGMPREDAFSSLRFTLSHATTRDEIDRTVLVMKGICGRLRRHRV